MWQTCDNSTKLAAARHIPPNNFNEMQFHIFSAVFYAVDNFIVHKAGKKTPDNNSIILKYFLAAQFAQAANFSAAAVTMHNNEDKRCKIFGDNA